MELSTRETAESSLEKLKTPARRIYAPRADIFETGESIVVLADMPGVAADDVEITLEKNVLTISGVVSGFEHDGYALAWEEYGRGDYRRVFSLSNEVDRDGIQASVKNGVLKLVLPKSKDSRPRRIEVRAE